MSTRKTVALMAGSHRKTMIVPETKKVLREIEAAKYCGSSVSTFSKLRCYGGGPAFCKLGRRVVYRIEDLDAWLEECVVRK